MKDRFNNAVGPQVRTGQKGPGRVIPALAILLLAGGLLKVTFVTPVGESLIDVIPVAEKIRQVTLRRSRCPDPNDCVEKQPGFAARTALARGNVWLDQDPFFIGQAVARFGHVICFEAIVIAYIIEVSQQRLVNWYRTGMDPAREMIKLTTYLGHSNPAHTYWYIEAVPEQLKLASQRLESSLTREVLL